MEYFIFNKKLKIPSLGFFHKLDAKNELKYYPKYNILSTHDLFVYTDLKNQYIDYDISYTNNFYVAPLIKELSQLKNYKTHFQFIIIEFFNLNIINYCKKHYIFPILFFNYNNFISNPKNELLKNYKFLNQELIIKILIEYGIIIISENKLYNFKFELFIGEIAAV